MTHKKLPAGNGAEDPSHEAAQEEDPRLPVDGYDQVRVAEGSEAQARVELPDHALVPGRDGVEDAAAVEAVEPEEGARERRPGTDEEHLGVRRLEPGGDLLSPTKEFFCYFWGGEGQEKGRQSGRNRRSQDGGVRAAAIYLRACAHHCIVLFQIEGRREREGRGEENCLPLPCKYCTSGEKQRNNQGKDANTICCLMWGRLRYAGGGVGSASLEVQSACRNFGVLF